MTTLEPDFPTDYGAALTALKTSYGKYGGVLTYDFA